METEVVSGSETNVLQGFIPHHYKGNTNAFSFLSGLDYTGTPRGTLKLAEGTSFAFNYEFNADILPHFNQPSTLSSETVPYDPEKMNEMIDAYAADVELYGIGGGTYWGGKYLLRALKYTLMAKETGNANYADLLVATKAKVYDWLTYTPGETENYYSYYPAWKALIGFNEEFYSAYFTDNHFHYGYLAHAGALLEMAEPGSMDGYWDMLTKIIKTYANWDRSDDEYPYLRTFSPWMGHSFASGLGNSIGNNQESSSEAMQSWAGMFMVAEMTENTEMRDAAAFGYLTEGRAIADYWYNESGSFDEVGYTKPITGILEMNRYVYGTFFGAQETYIHGIQWLPISPAYDFWNDFLTPSEANAIVDPIINNMANDLGGNISADWMNVSMGFKLFFDPEAVVSQFNDYWNSPNSSNEYQVAHSPGENGLTYYYAHASQNIGLRQSDYRLSLPLSSAFEKNGEMTCVVYNPSGTEKTCNVYKNNTLISSFSVPAATLITPNGTTTSTPDFPNPDATYYIDNQQWNLRLGANGGNDAYTTSTSTTGNNVEWTITPSPTEGYYYLDCVGGGNRPRIRTDRNDLADMQATSSGGSWTRWSLTDVGNGYYYLTTLFNSDHMRLQVNGSGDVRTVASNFTGTSERFRFTEASGEGPALSERIQAENFTAMNGILLGTANDDGGGEFVGWIDPNDWIEYSVNVPSAGNYTLDFRVASAPGQASASITANGSPVGTLNIDPTGGWQSWTTVTQTINLPAGDQTIRLSSNANNWNINWFEINQTNAVNARATIATEEQITEKGIIAYPLPLEGNLNVVFKNNLDGRSIAIFYMDGQRVYESDIIYGSATEVNVSSLPPGLYILRILTKEGNIILTKKIIK